MYENTDEDSASNLLKTTLKLSKTGKFSFGGALAPPNPRPFTEERVSHLPTVVQDPTRATTRRQWLRLDHLTLLYAWSSADDHAWRDRATTNMLLL